MFYISDISVLPASKSYIGVVHKKRNFIEHSSNPSRNYFFSLRFSTSFVIEKLECNNTKYTISINPILSDVNWTGELVFELIYHNKRKIRYSITMQLFFKIHCCYVGRPTQ